MEVREVKESIFSRNMFLILAALLCLPLFFINVRNSHDWGDDFAQYIMQAKNMVEHKPQTETGYVYHEKMPVVAPPAYPAGFPAMLAAVYLVKGNSIHAFNYLVTLLLFMLCLLMFLFFQKHFSVLTSVFLVLIFAYNPWTLEFKTQILSDIPFTLFFLLTTFIFLYGSKSNRNDVFTGISCGLMLSVRGVAAVFLIASFMYHAYLIIRCGFQKKESLRIAGKFTIIAALAIVVYVLLNFVLVNVPSGKFLEFYSRSYQKFSPGEIIIQNLNYYTDVFQAFFDPRLEKWFFITFVSKAFSLVLVLIGMFHCLLKKRSFIDLLTWSYIVLFLVYPYSAGGFRFILPLFPFLLYYMVMGMKQVHLNVSFNRKALIVAGGLFVILQYQHSVAEIIAGQHGVMQGPQEPASQEAFEYIRNNIPENAVIVFKKPKALALYTGRKTASTVYYQSPDEVAEMLKDLHARYLLVNHDQDPELGDDPLNKFIEAHKDELQLTWQNSKFFLYSRTTSTQF
ncbi:MAG: hypothetical protein NT126_02895 [Bacteroidetes bacterium]|nr:hypothetical protein [Bacteroidota bacterium]